jgi:hypothetical protein
MFNFWNTKKLRYANHLRNIWRNFAGSGPGTLSGIWFLKGRFGIVSGNAPLGMQILNFDFRTKDLCHRHFSPFFSLTVSAWKSILQELFPLFPD